MYILPISLAADSRASALAGSTVCLHFTAASMTMWWDWRAAM
eukprot:CAMPEP_0204034292 /NCGR_PEP_ID=MMETSP0360-20130528/73988_1 /ASSEMBLY_ACC=CAM_ASM_000342 /TAXON_ID=268821 /ORGANISM="Scrippsiella Hangoei, Strain SHTV-5" /LENGTH=41 /DNA_ID= /DNA_START= /DNA_END= /DNA_ORIENTATION=